MNKSKSFFLSLVFIVCLSSALLVGSRYLRSSSNRAMQEIRAELKKELLAEISQEVRGLVAQEVETYLAGYESGAEGEGKLQTAQETPLISPALSETKQEAMRRIVREVVRQHEKVYEKIRELSNNELDAVTASAFEANTPIPGGYQKLPNDYYTIAQVTSRQHDQAQTPVQEDLEIAGGKAKAESLERTLVQKGGILLAKGKLQIEPSITYAQFSSNRITIQGFSILPVLVIGQISTETVKRNVFISTMALKYGLWHNLQGELRVPYRYEHDRVTDTFGAESTREWGGLGDIEFGLSRQISHERGFIPDAVASVTVKTTTGKAPYNTAIGIGTGHWAVRGGLIAVKSSDPAVVFGSLNYTYNFPEEFENFGKIVPGDSMGYSLGTAIALSYQTAINFSYEQSITNKMKTFGRTVAGSFLNTVAFKSGFTWAINEKTSVDFSVGIGLTSDTPDVTATLRIPHTF